MNPAGVQSERRLLTEDAVAEQLACSVALLRKWRRLGQGPEFCRIGKLIRYPQEGLSRFIDTKKEQGRSDECNRTE